ncbi:hypothetical protein GCM10026983_21300 [Gracilibacillus alcaliphilus]
MECHNGDKGNTTTQGGDVDLSQEDLLVFGTWIWTWLFLNKNELMKNHILADLTKKDGPQIRK